MTNTMVLLLWLAKGTAVLFLAMALSAALRRAPAGARYVVWLAALAVLLLVPVLSTWTPVPVPILPERAAQMVSAIPEGQRLSEPPPSSPTRTAANTASEVPTATAVQGEPSLGRLAIDASTGVLMVWGVITALLFAWLVLGALKVRRIVRRGRALDTKDWMSPLYDVADRIDLANAPRLVMSDDVEMPFACGVVHPTIVLPTDASEWSEERRRVVLFHELAHVRRRDLLGHTVGRVTCALYWFHPLVWSAAKRLRAESERACDDLVLACGGARASDYATHLLDIVTGVRRHGAPATALPMADKKEFEGRMLAILDPTAKRVNSTHAQQIGVSIGFGALALSLAAVAPTRPTTPAAPPSRASTTAASPRPADDVRRDTPRVVETQAAQPEQPAQRRAVVTHDMTSDVVNSTTRETTRIVESAVTSLVTKLGTKADEVLAQGTAGPDTALLGRILRTDKDPGVRKSATWALQGRRDGVPLLLERLRVDEDDEVREMAAWALASFASDDIAAALATALSKDRSDEVRATAAWGLGHMASRANGAALEAALSDESSEVRQRALWALGHQRLDVAPRRVLELLTDSDRDVRIMAAWVLGEIRDQATTSVIRDAFAKERDHEVAQAEFRDLLLLGDRSQALIDRAMASEDPDIRARAVRLIAGRDPAPWPWPWPWPQPRPYP